MKALSTDDTLNGEIVTFTGRIIKPLEPDPAKVNIIDIAHSLANQCRFTGHVRQFYSVAEHSVRCSDLAKETMFNITPMHSLWALLHDASEAYLSDIARPIKMTEDFGRVYKAVEENLMLAIAEKFRLPLPQPGIVKVVDNVLLAAEQRDLMPRFRRHESDFEYPEEIQPWTPDYAKVQFLMRYEAITGEVPRR